MFLSNGLKNGLLTLYHNRENDLTLTIVKSTHLSSDSSDCAISIKTPVPLTFTLFKEPALQEKDELPALSFLRLTSSEEAGWCFPASTCERNKHLKTQTVPF